MYRRLTLLLLTGAALLAAPSAASAQADIEAVWSFSGGQVAVQAQSDGSFLGTVIRQTTFATCPHNNGEHMWTEVRAQPDGQYFGKHQWYNNADCSPTPNRGNTAFRVLAKPDGAKFLRVCFAGPENPELQPTIAADGTSANTTTACSDSDLVSALPQNKPTVSTIATLPSQGRKKCLSKRSFRIRLKEPPGDALESARVYVNNKRVGPVRTGDRLTAPVNLRNLPRGRYTVKITAKTVLGRTISGTRKYRTCARKRAGSNRSPV
jgi:hypothetical protein